MLTMPTSFQDFLKEIRPTKSQKDDYRDGHSTLRKRLKEDPRFKDIVLTTFLQGSYRRATAVRPKDDSCPDVDVVVVTNIDSAKESPQGAMDRFKPFLTDYYKHKWSTNARSFKISLSYVTLDLVITAKPSDEDAKALRSAMLLSDDDVDEADLVLERWCGSGESKSSPLLIPDRELKVWQSTHPLAQIKWTWEKNRACNRHYVNVVKALKWWRKEKHPDNPPYPRSYPFEHIVGQACLDGIRSVAEGVTYTLQKIAADHRVSANNQQASYLKDHGVDQNVLARVTGKDFKLFHEQVEAASKTASEALNHESAHEASKLWRELFGSKFPLTEDDGSGSGAKGGFTPRSDSSELHGGRRYA